MVSKLKVIEPTEEFECKRLEALKSLKILDTTPEKSYDRLVRIAIDLFNVPICYISFVDQNRQWFKARYGVKEKETPRIISFCNETIKKHGPLIINDTSLNEHFSNSPLVKEMPKIRFYAGVPLTEPEGYNVGTFCLADTSPNKLDSKQIELLINLAQAAQEQLRLRKTNLLLKKTKKQLEVRNKLIHKVFSFYMSDNLVKTILESPHYQKLGGCEDKITTMFCDLRNFTSLSETVTSEELIYLLNSYFSKMVPVITKYKGVVDSFIGDAIMVIFGSPYSSENDSLRAIECALEMQKFLHKLNRANQKKNLPLLEMGIGINTGVAIVGNVGSKKRMQYSAIGSSVNLSSRIQDLSLAGQILISEYTYKEVEEDIEIKGYLRVKVKGLQSPITIYDVSDLKSKK